MFSLQKVYKDSYEKNRGFSINYCETPKFQMDTVLKQFTDVRNTLKIKTLLIQTAVDVIIYLFISSFRHITKISMKMR